MRRMYKLQQNESATDIAKRGGGEASDLHAANKTWLSSTFQPWNPGQAMVVPPNWKPIGGEYAGDDA